MVDSLEIVAVSHMYLARAIELQQESELHIDNEERQPPHVLHLNSVFNSLGTATCRINSRLYCRRLMVGQGRRLRRQMLAKTW